MFANRTENTLNTVVEIGLPFVYNQILYIPLKSADREKALLLQNLRMIT